MGPPLQPIERQPHAGASLRAARARELNLAGRKVCANPDVRTVYRHDSNARQ
jgi:hypothetical protein